MKRVAKQVIGILAFLAVLPALAWYAALLVLLGRARACQSISQRVSRWPGVGGEYLRRSLLGRILARVGREVVISFGTVLTKPSIELGDGVYIGSYCLIGDVRVGSDTLIADHVLIPSGAHQHGIERLDIPIRQQAGRPMVIRIGKDCWIGSGSIVLADVGDCCVVAAGSVVTQPVGDYQIVAGVPARQIGDRRNRLPAGNSLEPGGIEKR